MKQMIKIRFKQMIAITLATVMLLGECVTGYAAKSEMENILPEDIVMTEDMKKDFLQTPEKEPEEQAEVLFELDELREQSGKQFRLSDGTILAAQYGMDVHYEAEDGSMKEIDNRFLYESAETAEDFAGYRTAEGAVEYKFAPQSGDGEILKLSEGGYSVGIELIVPQEEKLENEHSQMKEHEEVAVISELSMIPEDIVNLVVTETPKVTENPTVTETPVVTETPTITSVPVITQIPDATEEAELVASQNAPLVFLKGEVLNTEEIPHTMELVTTAEGLVTVEMVEAETDITASVEGTGLNENELLNLSGNGDDEEKIPVVWAEVENTVPESEDAERLDAMKVENAVTSVGYGNVLPGVSLQYVLLGNSLKEYILVNEKQEDYTYDFAMNLENLIPVLQEDGSILLLDAETEEAVYEIPPAFMTDAEGAYSDAVTMEITDISGTDVVYESAETAGKSEWILRISADKEWIDAQERAFPVQIDPTISQLMDNSNRLNAGFVTKAHPVESHTFSKNITVGYSPEELEFQSYVQFKNLPQLPKNSVVCAASFNTVLRAYSHQSFSSINVKVRKITGNNAWGTKYTWRSMPEISEIIMDYRRIDNDLEGHYVGWNITELVKEHYQAGNTDSVVSGFVLQSDEAAGMDGDDWANAFLCTGFESIYPQMYIVYRDTKGVEGYYTYQTHGLGNAGTAYLGDYNGQLTLIKPLASYESTILPYTLSLVYNSSFADRNFTNDGKNLHTEDFSQARTGPGWKLSAQETVVEVQLEEGDETKSWLIWNDSDGTEHYFKLKDGSTTVYEDEDGLNLTITKTDNGIDFTMKDKKDNQKFFKGGYLQKITDANGNIIHIVYNYGTAGNNQIDGAKSNPITSVWVQPKGGTAERILKLSYNDSGYMNLVEETYGTKTRIGYGMGNDGYSYPEIIYRYNEETSSFVQMVSYEYNAEDLLSVIQDVETKRGITYGYSKSPTGYRLVSWVELANGIAGHRATISSDEIRKTVYRDYGADRTAKTGDDILTTYAFNSSGHTVNIYSEDFYGELLGVTAAAYQEKDGTSKKNNSLSNSIAGGQAGVNLLLNGSFEKYGSDSAAASGWNKSGTGTAARRTTGPRSGNAHYNMYNASDSGSAVIAKTVSLTAGKTYTASAYVNTAGAESFASDGGAFLKVLNSSGSQIALGNLLTYWTDTNIDNGWQRISVTFTPAAGGNHQLCVQWKNAKGTLRVDDVQLEMEEAASSYNLVYNPSFENGADGWTLSTTGKESVGTADTVHGSKAFKATGYPGVSVVAQQTIPLEKSSDTTFLLSAWSKGNSLPELEKSPWDATKRYWGIRVTLNYSDQSIETHDLLFNEFVHQWQYASMAVAPKKEGLIIRNAAVQIFYNSNANSAVFDCISLTEEPCQTYTYDEEGNVKTVKSTGNGTESYSYKTGTQDLLSMGTAGSGTYHYKYQESGNKHLPVMITNDTVSMAIVYDSYGQSTSTTLSSSKDSTAKMQSTAVYADGLLTKQTDTTKTETVYGYNSDREHIYTTYANKQTIETHKDPVYERLDRTYQAEWASASYGYTNGNLTSITRSGYQGYRGTVKYNQIYGFSYDSFGNRTSVTVKGEKRNPSDNALLAESSAKTIATYSYNSGNGTLSKMTYGPSTSGPASIDYTYDKLDRISSVTYTNASPQKSTTYGYRYSSDGALAGITVDGTLKYTYEYDSLGRLIYSTKLSGNRPTLYTNHRYDTSDRITRQSWMVDGTGYEELYTYNTADGSLSSMKVNGEDLIFSYNALKQLSKRTSPRLDVEYAYGTTGDGFTTNQVTAIRYRKHGETTYRLPRLDYTYDAVGNIKTVTPLDKATVTYEYDSQNKLRKETKGTTVEGIYDIDTYGNIRSKQWKDSNGVRNYTFTYGTGGSNDAWMDRIKTVTFDNGSGTPVTKTLSYDVLGNPTKYYNGVGEWDFTWQYGRQLATAKKTGTNTTITNTYDVDGIRDSKTVGSVKHTYTTLSGKIVREKYGTTTVDYLYDNEGRPYKLILDLNGTKIHGYFALNLQGDVIAIIDSTGEVAVTYEYDAWGREIASSTAGDYGSRLYAENRLKYRGYYYDSETGFYYVSSRYYDPEVGRFISADGQIAGVGGEISGYNLYSYCQNNPVNMSDPDGNWPKWATKVAIGVAVIAAAAVVTVATAGAASGTLVAAVHCFAVGALKGAIIGGAVGAAVGGTTAAVKHRAKTGSWKGAGTAARDGAADGFMSGSIGGAISGGMTSNVCFVAGTSVLTVLGYTAIENISPGDKVWSENPETGEKELKEVVQTFVNETDELVHVHVNGEEIITTPEHPFYVPKKGWVGAIDLRAGDILVLQSGEYVVVELIQHEILEAPVKVYNFEVADYHTYYVGDNAVLVHNACGARNTPDQDALIKIAKDVKKTGLSRSEADIMWEWTEEVGLSSLKNYHPPKFDSYLGGTQLHMKINGMHINIFE